jgi:hypothetical protein
MKRQGNRPDFGSRLAPVRQAEVAAPSEHRLEAYATVIATRMALRDRSKVRKTNVA